MRPTEPSKWTSRTFASLAHRNYRLYFVGNFISLIGMWMKNAAESWLVFDMTRSEAMLGAVGIASSVPVILLSTWGGVLADRFDRRHLIIIGQIVMTFLSAFLATLVLADSIQIWHIMVLAAAAGIVSGLESPSRYAFVVEMVGRKDLLNAIALNSSVFHASRILGPTIAGIIIAAWGTGPCFVINTFAYAGVLTALFSMRLARRIPEPAKGSAFQQAMEGLKVAYRTPRVMALLLVMLVVGIFGWSYVILLPSLARETLNTDATGYGWMMSATGLGSVIGALWIASTKDMGSGRFMVGVSVGIFAVAALALSFSTSLPIVLLLLLPCGFGLTAFFSGTNTLIQSSVSDSVRGRVMGIYTLAFGTLMPLGALYAGSLAEWTSTPLAIRVGASICLVTAIVTLVKKPPVSDRAGR